VTTLTTTLYVDDLQKLAELLQDLALQPVIGLDTEFISEGRYEPELCLVQLSTPDQIYIVDPLAFVY
jgi:ribonuclease D